MARFTSMRKLDLENNTDLTAVGWKALLSNLHPTVEELNLGYCSLDDSKAAILIYFGCPLA